MARGKPHSDETRAAVIAALATGQGVGEVARKYKLAKSTVSGIKNSLMPNAIEQFEPKKRESLDDLILEAVCANVNAMKAIAVAVSDEKYIQKQPAEAIGVLYGILSDKAVRFLEAAAAAGEEE